MCSTNIILFLTLSALITEVYCESLACRSESLANELIKENSLIPTRESCGFQEADRIYNGNVTSLEEYPWMVQLVYQNATGHEVCACGGTIISSRYVVTAAHCIPQKGGIENLKLTKVRLGEWDMRTKRDCVKIPGTPVNICNDPSIDVTVEKAIKYPSFTFANKNRCDDIGLLRLAENINFTNFIRPICLPHPNERVTPGERMIVAGWGKTEKADYSPVKLKLAVPYIDDSQCYHKFRTAGLTLGVSQLCAGGEVGKDACVGDSGGPLMTTTRNDSSQWYLEGVISFGKCSNMRWPAVYTRLTEYLDWIHNNIEP